MTIAAVGLEEQLRLIAKKCDIEGQLAALVLRWGQRYFPQKRPKKYAVGQPTMCYANSYRCAKRHKIIYVEGFGISPLDGAPYLHAWCAEPGSRLVIDRTCQMLEYIGIPFQFRYVHARWEAEAIGVIHDHGGGFPLLKMTEDQMEAIIVEN